MASAKVATCFPATTAHGSEDCAEPRDGKVARRTDVAIANKLLENMRGVDEGRKLGQVPSAEQYTQPAVLKKELRHALLSIWARTSLTRKPKNMSLSGLYFTKDKDISTASMVSKIKDILSVYFLENLKQNERVGPISCFLASTSILLCQLCPS